jgi:hypothetical protein
VGSACCGTWTPLHVRRADGAFVHEVTGSSWRAWRTGELLELLDRPHFHLELDAFNALRARERWDTHERSNSREGAVGSLGWSEMEQDNILIAACRRYPVMTDQSSGRAAKSRLVFLYHPIPEMGFFHRPFISFKALWCASSPPATISFRWLSCAFITSSAVFPWSGRSHGPPKCLHVIVFISLDSFHGIRPVN